MAERRFSNTDRIGAAQQAVRLLGDLAPAAGWLVRDASDAVLQPFYAALDSDRRLCWTDERARAQCFDTKQQAERFAVDRAMFDVRVVKGR